MNIDPLSNYGQTQRSQIRPSSDNRETAGSARGADAERLSAELTGAIREIFASTPEIRPEVVEHGRKLLADPAYPSQEIVERIAALVTPLSEE